MPESPQILPRMLLDAQDELARAVDHVPPPGRGGRVGRLNSAAWIIAHAAAIHDAWINRFAAGLEAEHWLAEWSARQRALPEGQATETVFDEATAALERTCERAAAYLQRCDASELSEVTRAFDGSDWEGRTHGYLVARGVAHLFAHAGELTVIASLLDRGDLGLPGRLTRSTAAGGATAAGDLVGLVHLLLDAREQFARVADAVPVPAQHGAFRRLNAGGWIVAHIAAQDDQYWNVGAQGLEPDPWLASLDVGYGSPPSAPHYGEATTALRRSNERSREYIESLRDAAQAGELERVVRRSPAGFGDQTLRDLLVRQTAHDYALAGELSAIASLAGVPDLMLPGTLAHSDGSAEGGR